MNAATPFTVLVVEDEPQIRRVLHSALEAEGFRVVEAATGRRALVEAASHKPDLVLLDLGLPDMDGSRVIAGIREWGSLPIVVLSARSEEARKIAALDAGADDYVTKPFGVGELLARVRVALRHAARPAEQGDAVLRMGELEVDLARREVRGLGRDGKPVHLTPTEFRLLAALARHDGLVATQRALLREVWGPNAVEQAHYLRIYMKQLRDKLEPDPVRPRHLITEPGVGYRWRREA